MSVLEQMQAHLDGLTKPRGSLGKLEEYAMRLATIQGRVPPRVNRMLVVVLAADHGIANAGVSLYPQEVTGQMVTNFASGGAAINVLARHCGFDVLVVDAGVAATIEEIPGRVQVLKVRAGTNNALEGPAMSESEREEAIANGERLADRIAREGYDLVAIGDMGIGNTTVAAAMLCSMGFGIDEVVDRGTGIDERTLEHKRGVVRSILDRHPGLHTPRLVVERVGGTDSATTMGLILGLRGAGIACVLDGFPVTSAAWLAFTEDPSVRDFCFAGHRSRVRGHQVVLKRMELEAVVDLHLRLGEGTGAVIGGKMLQLAAAITNEMATFDSAGVTASTGDEEDY